MSKSYERVKASKINVLMKIKNPVMHKNPIIVPIIPKNAKIAKF
jgi:hypothetical protein